MKLIAANCEDLIKDLTEEELVALVRIVGDKTDRLEMIDGKPKFTAEEIDLIGRFADFVENDDNIEIDEDDDEDDEDEDAPAPGVSHVGV